MPDRTTADGSPLARVRAPWFAGGRKAFVMAADRHHDDRVAFWAAAPDGAREALVADAAGPAGA